MATTIHTPHEEVKANIATYLKSIAPDVNQAARTRIADDCSTSLPTVNMEATIKLTLTSTGTAIKIDVDQIKWIRPVKKEFAACIFLYLNK